MYENEKEVIPEDLEGFEITSFIESSSKEAQISPLLQYWDALKPLFILIASFITAFLILIIIDPYDFVDILKIIEHPSENAVSDLLANAGGEIMLGLLGIAITMVAIIVELAANRYTARVIDLFVKDKINLIVLILLTVTSINLVIILYFANPEHARPYFLINFTVFLMMFSILTLVPYFIYVFKFLEPINIISKIEKDIFFNASKAIKPTSKKKYRKRTKKIESGQRYVVQGIDQLTDITLNSIDKKDKILATSCIKSVRNFTINYLDMKIKSRLLDKWFHPSQFVRYNNADFVTLTNTSFEKIVTNHTWVEHKLFKQFENIYRESINKSRDICNFIAQCFFMIGAHATNLKDYRTIQLVTIYFNTLLRATINNRDVRTCFNLLNQYRHFGEQLVDAEEEKFVIDIATYFKSYGLLANSMKLSFVLETAAHDLCDLDKRAFKKNLDKQGEILDIILRVDVPLEGEKEGSSLRGIRKAQVILATYYMSLNSNEAHERAMKIYYDMLDEIKTPGGYGRIFDIVKELKYIKEQYWEIIDRGHNFDYVPLKQKPYLQIFVDWFNIRHILYYAYYLLKGESSKSDVIIKDFITVIEDLPTETPIELKEFEEFFGQDGIDNKQNVYKHIMKLKDYFQTAPEINRQIKQFCEFTLTGGEVEQYNFIKCIELFFSDIEQIYNEKFRVDDELILM